jgi:hypothetical protein
MERLGRTLALLLSLLVAFPQVSLGHSDQKDRWGFPFGQHWGKTTVADPTWDYAIDYCFSAWPGGTAALPRRTCRWP